MTNTIERFRNIAELDPLQCAALLTRVGLGVMYVGHVLMMFGVLGFDVALHSIGLPAWFAYLTTAGELAGGALLIVGRQVRWTAVALLPFLIASALLHIATGVGATLSFAIYFVVTLAGQCLLAAAPEDRMIVL